jgi:hypothetical protein
MGAVLIAPQRLKEEKGPIMWEKLLKFTNA